MYARLLVANAGVRSARVLPARVVPRGFSSTPSSRTASETGETGVTQKPPTARPVSSVAHGTVLKGLNIYKEGKDPVALKDEEYPDWLWTMLDKVPDEQKSEREQQRLKRSKSIKEANFMKSRK
ncbi:hypothetical protein LPJ63_000154 [Coemansia sp. RSA 2711]|nr:hypothetical protein LPJ63_000154 [Coemansia sp. RSA 2711]KAJ2325298.1 hypothetical protein IWW51_002854 [Coemansia sp. RSA 2702]KAJ2362351.1 hypothetical protein H4S01_004821 [Coemansia sp. RSA 2610]